MDRMYGHLCLGSQIGLQQAQDAFQRLDVILIELGQLRRVDIQHSDDVLALDQGEHDLALGAGVTGDVARELFDVGDNDRLGGAGAVKADAAAFENLASHRSLVGPHDQAVVGVDEVEASLEVVRHLVL